MDYDVNKAKYLGDYRIEITFKNGISGSVDFEKFIEKGGVFSKLSKLANFKKFKINKELGVLTWGKDVDIAPETLYAEVFEGKSYIKGPDFTVIRYSGAPELDEIIQTAMRAKGFKLRDEGYNSEKNIRDLRFIRKRAGLRSIRKRAGLRFNMKRAA